MLIRQSVCFLTTFSFTGEYIFTVYFTLYLQTFVEVEKYRIGVIWEGGDVIPSGFEMPCFAKLKF